MIFGFAYMVIIGTAYCVFVYGLIKRIELVFKITRVFISILFGWDLLTFYADWLLLPWVKSLNILLTLYFIQ
jgi:hypothetical protein